LDFIKMIIFILGGARSGKSEFALKLAESLNAKNFYYIATAQALDEEMKERIKKHKEKRNKKWQTVEEPFKIEEVLKKLNRPGNVILIDCLTLWITNLMMFEKDLKKEFEKFLMILKKYKGKKDVWLICISNEVGLGVIPETKTGRKFRDITGEFHQKLAQISDENYFIIAGCPIKLTSFFYNI